MAAGAAHFVQVSWEKRRRAIIIAAGVLLAGGTYLFLMPSSVPEKPEIAGVPQLVALDFSDLKGWSEDRHDEALRVFVRSCGHVVVTAAAETAEPGRLASKAWQSVCARAASLGETPAREAARAFFETGFRPYRVVPADGARGFFTGYYEPEVDGALERGDGYVVPLYGKPADLVPVKPGDPASGLDAALSAARKNDAGLSPYPTRAEIEAGALAGQDLELVYLKDPVDAFFIHVQGSARVRLGDGTVKRIGFAAKNGHPYTSIGRVLIQSGAIAPADMSAKAVRQWLHAHPDEAASVMRENRSFIFFRELGAADPALGPDGAQGVPLTPQRSLAVDRGFHALGTPVWIDAEMPNGENQAEPYRRLLVAQDTGSAIVGVARGDIFFGSGPVAGERAGLIRHAGEFTILLPRDLALPDWSGKAAPAAGG